MYKRQARRHGAGGVINNWASKADAGYDIRNPFTFGVDTGSWDYHHPFQFNGTGHFGLQNPFTKEEGPEDNLSSIGDMLNKKFDEVVKSNPLKGGKKKNPLATPTNPIDPNPFHSVDGFGKTFNDYLNDAALGSIVDSQIAQANMEVDNSIKSKKRQTKREKQLEKHLSAQQNMETQRDIQSARKEFEQENMNEQAHRAESDSKIDQVMNDVAAGLSGDRADAFLKQVAMRKADGSSHRDELDAVTRQLNEAGDQALVNDKLANSLGSREDLRALEAGYGDYLAAMNAQKEANAQKRDEIMAEYAKSAMDSDLNAFNSGLAIDKAAADWDIQNRTLAGDQVEAIGKSTGDTAKTIKDILWKKDSTEKKNIFDKEDKSKIVGSVTSPTFQGNKMSLQELAMIAKDNPAAARQVLTFLASQNPAMGHRTGLRVGGGLANAGANFLDSQWLNIIQNAANGA